eukprot:TRINITY_DN976_c0_g1_i15.p4 TRINITY_DN976_c0_g1~~TRINITY_DN976_c0_g1_i15.p4  ORF type:complete len:262 (+),score=0.51 TRINITY_DN976_c0_g1_i15:315-1100(+)
MNDDIPNLQIQFLTPKEKQIEKEKERRRRLKFLSENNVDLYTLSPEHLTSLKKKAKTKEKLKEINKDYRDTFFKLQTLRKKELEVNPTFRYNGTLLLMHIRNLSITRKGYVFKDLYRLLYCHDLYYTAYERIRSNKEALTIGPYNQTIDYVTQSSSITRLIEELRNGSYSPIPVRRIYIPKPQKKGFQPLGIPSIRDKLIQEIIRLILDAIFEPTFLDCARQALSSRMPCRWEVGTQQDSSQWVRFVVPAVVLSQLELSKR